MRIALLSDIHGNLVALQAVLADLGQEHMDHIICLGDAAASGPQPRDVIAQLEASSCRIVMGNMDAWLLDPKPFEAQDEDSRRISEIELWSAAQLTPADLDYVRTFQPSVEVSFGDGATLLCVHASPLSHTQRIASTTPDDDLDRMLSGYHAQILASGHTHTPMLRRYRDMFIVNPGSVGLPFERLADRVHNPAWAEYAVVSRANGKLGIELRRVPFDVSALTLAALQSGMPHAEWWMGNWG